MSTFLDFQSVFSWWGMHLYCRRMQTHHHILFASFSKRRRYAVKNILTQINSGPVSRGKKLTGAHNVMAHWRAGKLLWMIYHTEGCQILYVGAKGSLVSSAIHYCLFRLAEAANKHHPSWMSCTYLHLVRLNRERVPLSENKTKIGEPLKR